MYLPVHTSRCHVCGFETDGRALFQSHMTEHRQWERGSFSLHCCVCDHLTNQEAEMRAHANTHIRGNIAASEEMRWDHFKCVFVWEWCGSFCNRYSYWYLRVKISDNNTLADFLLSVNIFKKDLVLQYVLCAATDYWDHWQGRNFREKVVLLEEISCNI